MKDFFVCFYHIINVNCFSLQIPPYSSIRLVTDSHRKQERKNTMPQDTQALMSWVKSEYNVITSYTELKRGNHMTLNVGLGKEIRSQ